MSKRWVAILLVAAALLTVLSQVLSHRDSSDWRANRSRRLLPFPWKDAVAFELVRPGGETVTLFRPAGGEWRIALADDLSDLVDLTVVDEMSAFATLAWREPLPRPQPVNPDTALRLTATSVEGQRVEMLFGDAADTLRSVVVDGDDSAVYGIPQDLLKFLEWPADRLRSLRLAAASSGSTPVRIVLDPAGGDEGLRLEMERRPEGWQLVQPLAWPVDESRVDLLLRWFDRLGADAIVAETVEDAAEYGFDADSALVEIELDTLDGRLRRRIRFSQPSAESESVYALVEGRTPLFTVSSHTLEGVFLTDIVDRPKEWRNLYRSRSIDILEGESPDLLVIEQLLPEPAPLRLERIRDQAGIRWRGVLERSGTTVEFPVDPPDPAEPNRPLTALMNSLASLRVRNFLADAAPGADTLKWTAFPAWRIQARLHDGRMSQPLTIYAEDSDGNFSFGKPYRDGDANPVGFVAADYGPAFTVGDAPAVMEMFPESVYSLCVPPYRYRSVKVIDQDPRNWTRVELHSDDKKMVYLREVGSPNDQWWREEDGAVEPLTDDNNLFVGLLLKLSQLRSIGFVGDDDSDAGEFGLDHPEISAIVYVSSEAADDADGEQELFTLSIGDEARYGANARYARLDQGGAVFLLSESLAEGLRRKYR